MNVLGHDDVRPDIEVVILLRVPDGFDEVLSCAIIVQKPAVSVTGEGESVRVARDIVADEFFRHFFSES